MNWKLALGLLTVAIFVMAVQFSEPASAAKLIDSGKRNVVLSQDDSTKTGTWYYKTWNEGYYLHTHINAYESGYGKFLTADIYLRKISRNEMKYTVSRRFKNQKTNKTTYILPYTKSASHWYWNTPLIKKIKIWSNGWIYPLDKKP